jgi:hypothetical protein
LLPFEAKLVAGGIRLLRVSGVDIHHNKKILMHTFNHMPMFDGDLCQCVSADIDRGYTFL